MCRNENRIIYNNPIILVHTFCNFEKLFSFQELFKLFNFFFVAVATTTYQLMHSIDTFRCVNKKDVSYQFLIYTTKKKIFYLSI